MNIKVISLLLTGALMLAGCAGRTPNPVPLTQMSDATASCHAIFAEVDANNAIIRRLSKERGYKVVQNTAAGVAGIFIPVLWLGMDLQRTQDIETDALNRRQSYLQDLLLSKHCLK